MKFKRFIPVFLLLILFSVAAPAAKDQKQPVSDDAIHDQVLRRLANDYVVKGGGLQVDVKDGVVTLRGTVEQQKQKARAGKLVRKVNGVKKVENELTIGPHAIR